MLIQKATGKVEKELVLQTRDATSVHGQFRHIRMTPAGTFLVAHMDLGKVVEYSADGKEIWSVAAPSAWAAVRLKNGNTLISGNEKGYVREVNRQGRNGMGDRQERPARVFRSIRFRKWTGWRTATL